MPRCAFPLVMLTAVCVLAALDVRAEQAKDGVANPAYKNWSSFKIGATAALKTVVVDKSTDDPNTIDATARPDAPAERIIVYKLIQSTPEKAVVEMVQTEIDPGSETEHAPVKITYLAKVEMRHKEQTLPKSKVGGFKEGTEELEVGGKKIKCNWVESEIKVGDELSKSKLWWSDSVPGGTVKQVTSKIQGGKVFFETTTTLVNFSTGK